jgi:hypothetical protein
MLSPSKHGVGFFNGLLDRARLREVSEYEAPFVEREAGFSAGDRP